MTQYLIRSIEHNGETFTDVVTVRENEMYRVVEAESKEEAERKYNELIQCPNCGSWNTDKEHAYAEGTPVLTFFHCYDCDFKDNWKFKENNQ